MHTCIPSHRLLRIWHPCPSQVNAGNKNTPSMHHPQRRNVTTSVDGIKTGRKSHPKWWTPEYSLERRRRRRRPVVDILPESYWLQCRRPGVPIPARCSVIMIMMSVFLERLSMWNMLNCAEQVQIQRYKTHAYKTPRTACVQTIALKCDPLSQNDR